MVKYAAKVDANQSEIVDALRQLGCTVESLHRVGAGVPDLLVGRSMRNYLFEVKGPKGKLQGPQIPWHEDWRGQVCVIRCWEDAAQHMGIEIE
jgi:hypothetical protein